MPRPMRECLVPDIPQFITQALWSDPSDSDAEMASGVHQNPERGGGKGYSNTGTGGTPLTPGPMVSAPPTRRVSRLLDSIPFNR